MRILLIKPKHIGDTLLLTPTVVGLRQAYPTAEIWGVVRRNCASILVGCPELNRVLTVSSVDRNERRACDLGHDLRTVAALTSHRFDFVFELGDGHRGRWLAWLARGKKRYSVPTATPLPPGWKRFFNGIASGDSVEVRHRVEKDYRAVGEFLPLPAEIPPLRFARDRARSWPGGATLGDFVVVQIGKRQAISRWGHAGWAAVVHGLLRQVAHVVVATGTHPEELAGARQLRQACGPRVILTEGQADWPEIADLLFRARLYVGLDTAMMHLAAACACPIVALFGPTDERHWAPWRAKYRVVLGGPPAAKIGSVKERSMTAIQPEAVLEACQVYLLK